MVLSPTTQSLSRALAVASASLILITVGATGAAARPDAGGPVTAANHLVGLYDYVHAPLMRIGTQLVRGDNLTGAGVSAPLWLPEQGVGRSDASAGRAGPQP